MNHLQGFSGCETGFGVARAADFGGVLPPAALLRTTRGNPLARRRGDACATGART